MKRIALLILLCVGIKASAQVQIGWRDTYYAQIAYQYKDTWSVKLEHSVYSEHIEYQKVRLYLGYEKDWDRVNLKIEPYFSTLWNAAYLDFGALVKSDVRVLNRWNLDATINPHYDTQAKYNTCFSAGTSVLLAEQISLIAHYSNIPEFRTPESRLRVGLSFKVQNLSLVPELSIPLEGQKKTVRVLFSFKYQFKNTKF